MAQGEWHAQRTIPTQSVRRARITRSPVLACIRVGIGGMNNHTRLTLCLRERSVQTLADEQRDQDRSPTMAAFCGDRSRPSQGAIVASSVFRSIGLAA